MKKPEWMDMPEIKLIVAMHSGLGIGLLIVWLFGWYK